MKKLFLLLTLFYAWAEVQAQSKSLQSFFSHYHGDLDALTLSVPGWVMNWINDDDQIYITSEIKKAAKKCQLLILDRFDESLAHDFSILQYGLNREGYDLLLQIKEGQQGIHLYGLEGDPEAWKNLILMIGGEDDTVVLNLQGHFKQKMVHDLKAGYQKK